VGCTFFLVDAGCIISGKSLRRTISKNNFFCLFDRAVSYKLHNISDRDAEIFRSVVLQRH
jgi:hypothetical protein